MAVGVEGRSGLEVGAIDGTPVAAFQHRRIDDGGIGLERHSPGETIEEDSGDKGAFGIDGDLAFDERGHGDDLLNVVVEAELGIRLAEAAHHDG